MDTQSFNLSPQESAEIYIYGLRKLSRLANFGNNLTKAFTSGNRIKDPKNRDIEKDLNELSKYFHLCRLAIHEAGHAVAYLRLFSDSEIFVNHIIIDPALGFGSEIGEGVAGGVKTTYNMICLSDGQKRKEIAANRAGTYYESKFIDLFVLGKKEIKIRGSDIEDMRKIGILASEIGITQEEAIKKADEELNSADFDNLVYVLSAKIIGYYFQKRYLMKGVDAKRFISRL